MQRSPRFTRFFQHGSSAEPQGRSYPKTRLSLPLRALAIYLATAQLFSTPVCLTGLGVLILPAPASRAAGVEPTAPGGAADNVQHPAPVFTPQNVTVNRAGNQDAAPPAVRVLPDLPSEAEFFRLGGLSEPLVPVGPRPAVPENQALATALKTYATARAAGGAEDVSALTGFLGAFPTSAWRPALLTNLGLIYRQTGYFSRALDAYEEAWTLTKTVEDPPARNLADRALVELVELSARLGRQERLTQLLGEADAHPPKGSAGGKLESVRSGLWMMQNRPELSFKCGPYALGRILAATGTPLAKASELVHDFPSTAQGTSLSQVAQWSKTLGLNYRVARRQAGAAVLTPAVVHWKAGHYAAVVREVPGGKFWVEDPTFGDGMQVSHTALDQEASGFFLVPRQAGLPTGWAEVSDQEAATVWGKGQVTGQDPDPTTPCDHQSGGGSGGCVGCGEGPGAPGPNYAMAGYSVHTMLVSLHLTDTPLGYTPPLGPSVGFTVTYNQYETNQLAGFNYSNLGPLWSFGWLSYLTADASQNVAVHVRGGGVRRFPYSTFDANTGVYGPNVRGQARLKRLSATSYEHLFPDGSKEVYDVADSAGNVFLSKIVDAQGNALSLHYDASFRLDRLDDALGQSTTLSYGLGDDLYKVTKITDPFGRFATFGYTKSNGVYQLTSITDVIGLTSWFTYDGTGFVHFLTTPYGTTTFNRLSVPGKSNVRVLEAVDPYGATERWEGWISGAPITADPSALLPRGMDVSTVDWDGACTFYWDKKAMLTDAAHPYANATQYHWMHTAGHLSSGILRAKKLPLENRVWFNYPGGGGSYGFSEGTMDRPSAVGRVLDDGTTQVNRFEYNAVGNMTKAVWAALDAGNNPVDGRTTFNDYDAATGMDLLMVRQQTDASTSVVLEKRLYDPADLSHRSKQVLDASGQVTSFTYDAQGRVLTATNARNEKTTYSYTRPNAQAGPADGYLYLITGAVSGATTAYTYDALGRRRTVTDCEGYKLTYDYDALNRPTVTTYPDGTYSQISYDRLDVEWSRDRINRWTHRFYDALRHLVAVQDPLGRTTNYGYCLCGAMNSLTDAAGNVTRWDQDLQSRPKSKTYADNTQVSFSYENTTSRLKGMTDAMGQVTNYTYFVDDKLKQTSYTTDAAHATPTVSFTYDPVFDRPATMVDGTGTTTYGYGAYSAYSSYSAWPGGTTTGAGRLASEGKKDNTGQTIYTLTYGYDEMGRQTGRAIDGAANQSTATYDALGRLSSVTNPLGTFGYDYTTATSRQVALAYLGSRNGLRTSYSYYPNGGDRRLQTINNLAPTGVTISRFDYTYGAVGNIVTWTQQADSQTPQAYRLDYDRVDQLTGAVLKDTSTQAVLKTYVYGYDSAANRTSEQIDLGVTSATPNNLNQITSVSAGGPLRFLGTLSEPATVTVGGNPAQVTGNQFAGYANVAPGANTVAVSATDRSGQITTNRYQVQVNAGAGRTLIYDLNGNLTDDGAGKTYGWDAANRLTAINYASTSARTEFAYDGMSHRVQIIEKNGSAVTSAKALVWCGRDSQPCEERSGSNVVIKRFFSQGEQAGGLSCFYKIDHLGSVREVTDGAGAVRARYNYDLYGRQAKLSGDLESSFGFTGHYSHGVSGLHLAWYRAYDGRLGRWLNRDPLKNAETLLDGPNVYDYVANDPVNLVDHDGQYAFVIPIVIEIGELIQGLVTLVCVAGATIGSAPKTCPPCSPYPIDTIGYRYDTGHTHYPAGDPHLNLYIVSQVPFPSCKCFWNKNSPAAVDPPPQPGWIPLPSGVPFPPLSP